MNPAEMAYRKTAAQGASGLGLLIALYDTLAGNLRRAAEAERCNDIEKRCQEINHALLVIAHLEEWIDHGTGGKLADKLVAFYSSVRRNMIQAQAKRSAEMLEQQMQQVLKVRATWQGLELRGPSSTQPAAARAAAEAPAPSYPGAPPMQQSERSASSWSA
jgi:flagellar protein FliS